jgi:hypothetical protein
MSFASFIKIVGAASVIKVIGAFLDIYYGNFKEKQRTGGRPKLPDDKNPN